MILFLLIIILIISMVSIFYLIAFRRQIDYICRQLAFLEREDSNLKITSIGPGKEISRLINSINCVLEKYRKDSYEVRNKNTIVREAVINLSHDIRTPLAGIDGYVQLLEDTDMNGEQEEYISLIRERTEAMKYIFDELYLYAKLQEKKLELVYEKIDMSRLVFRNLTHIYEELEEKNIDVDLHGLEENIFIYGDMQITIRILDNLFRNSLLHGNERLEISLSDIECKDTEKRYTRLKIANGIDESQKIDVERVFDTFYKVDASRHSGSTGLGLAITKELIEKMDGYIRVDVKDGMFTVTIDFLGSSLCVKNDDN